MYRRRSYISYIKQSVLYNIVATKYLGSNIHIYFNFQNQNLYLRQVWYIYKSDDVFII